MSTKALLLAAAHANIVVAFRFVLPADTPGPSATASAFTGPITPGPLVPWSNTTSPWANTTSSTSSDAHCFECPGYGYPYASSCSQASQDWSSASDAWWSAHFTVSQSILPSLVKYTTWIQGPRHRNVLGNCFDATPMFIFSNVENFTDVRPEFSDEVVAAGYPVDEPPCTINRLDCSSLWDVHDAQPTAQPVPTCNDYALHLPCLAPYILPTDYSLEIPTFTWTVPTTAFTPPSFVPINPSDLPGGLFAPIPHHSTTPASPQQQQQPTQQPSPQQTQPPPTQQSTSPSPAGPITTTTLVNNVPLTATIYPPQTLPSTTIDPSIVIAGTTLLPSSPPVTVGGAVLSAALPSGALVCVTSTTITPTFSAVAASAPEPHPAAASPQYQDEAVEQITVAGHTWTVTSRSSAMIFGSGSTASVGGPAITLTEPADSPLPSLLAPSADAASAGPVTDSQEVEVVSAAPGGSIVVIHQSTVIAMPTSTAGASSATQAQGEETASTVGAVSSAGTDTLGTEPNSGPLASAASASLVAAAAAAASSSETISTSVKGSASGVPASGSSRGQDESVHRAQGAAAGYATPKSWTLWAAVGMLAMIL